MRKMTENYVEIYDKIDKISLLEKSFKVKDENSTIKDRK